MLIVYVLWGLGVLGDDDGIVVVMWGINVHD